jgi:hypothetical protein
MTRPSLLLVVDATACVALSAVAFVVAATADTTDLLGVSTAVLVVLGVALGVYAVEAGLVSRRPTRAALRGIAVVNVAFALIVAVGGIAVEPNALGAVLVAVLAAVCLAVAGLVLALRTRVLA